MTFKVGDRIISLRPHESLGEGEVLCVLNSTTLAVRFDSYDNYDDDGLEDSSWPDLPDFHYVQIKNAQHVVQSFNYNPEQTGDRDDDI